MNRDDDGKKSPLNYVFIGFLAIAAFFLLFEHRAHLFGILPFLLLAACPLLHIFGHRHGGHGGHGESKPERPPGGKSTEPPEHSHH